MKRVGIFSDLHCGHVVGLTAPEYQLVPAHKTAKWDRLAETQAMLWDWFAGRVKTWQPLDIAIYNGDLIDGKGLRSGGTEQICASLQRQCEMARSVINFVGAPVNKLIYGTPYHVNGQDGEDWESTICQDGDTIESHGFFNINGVVFDCKHKVGSSSIPHGRHTAPAKEKLWNEIWAGVDGQPKADVLIRSHVHYFSHCGDNRGLCITTPALQGMGSKFGARQCSGIVDFGFIVFEVEDDGTYRWFPEVLECKAQAAKIVNL